MRKWKVAILFGGWSEEHDISVKSAIRLAKSLDGRKYEGIFIGITREGIWKLCPYPCKDWESRSVGEVFLSPSRGMQGLLQIKGDKFQRIGVDVFFPMLHGRGGEDGCIQGLLALSGIPYVGCDVQSSAVCMDKALTYILAANAGVPVPEHWTGTGERLPAGAGNLPYPVFVKPARSGSSFGVTKADTPDELLAAIKLAKAYDNKILIERAVSGVEVGCAVMGSGDSLITGEADQITLKHGFFRIHQETNPEQGSQNYEISVPANITDEQAANVKQTAKTVYTALGCKGLARVDMFLCPNGQVVLNEVNTMPGFTSYSRFPRMMEAAGWKLPQVIDWLIDSALKEANHEAGICFPG